MNLKGTSCGLDAKQDYELTGKIANYIAHSHVLNCKCRRKGLLANFVSMMKILLVFY